MMIRFAVLTVSDRSFRGERNDASGPQLVEAIVSRGWQVIRESILPDEEKEICRQLIEWADADDIDVILTTGGTGFSPRDVTPEATKAVIQREAPGLAEAMRLDGFKHTPHAMLSRAVSGIRGRCLIVNLPGSPRGALENLQAILPVLPHAVQLLGEDSSAEAFH